MVHAFTFQAMIAVRMENLVKRFGPVSALNGVDLTVEQGELFFLLGPSGAGKTTLLRCLAGLTLPDEGRIWFGDEDVTRLEPNLRQTGMVFQNYALWPHLSVADNVGFGLKQQRRTREEIAQRVAVALAAVRLTGQEAARIQQLSGGQQQRVALARALVTQPRCLLLDEPLSNLDARLRQELRAEIRRICKESGLTTIYVTHDQKEALALGDRIAVLAEGRVRQVGPPREIYRRPRDRFVADFIGETNFLEGEVRDAGAGLAWVRTNAGDFQGTLADPAAEPAPGAKVLLSIRPEGLRLLDEPAEENTLTGRLGEVTYFGDSAHFEFEAVGRDGQPLTPPTRLRICELNPRSWEGRREKTLFAYADPDDVVVLPMA
jgi:iron(III) transport system ATP-binding protein